MDGSSAKILLQDGDNVETVWAECVGPDLYRLDNSPFWAYGVSWKDVVEAHPEPDGMLRMTRVAEKAGHRTIRIFFEPDAITSNKAQEVLEGVAALGASYEGMTPRYLAVDVPPGIDLMAVGRFLTERSVQWEHADPMHEELYGKA